MDNHDLGAEEIRKNIMLFKKEQKLEMEMVKEKYFSPEEMQRMKKAKLRIKVHF